jgi:chromosome segregation ATPase
LGFLSRKKIEKVEVAAIDARDDAEDLAPRLDELQKQIGRLATQLEKVERLLREKADASDYRLLASEIARLEDEVSRGEAKQKEGMLALYAQVHKELRAIRGDRVVEMIDIEPVTDEKLEEASDQLSELAKTWRKRRAQPGHE